MLEAICVESGNNVLKIYKKPQAAVTFKRQNYLILTSFQKNAKKVKSAMDTTSAPSTTFVNRKTKKLLAR